MPLLPPLPTNCRCLWFPPRGPKSHINVSFSSSSAASTWFPAAVVVPAIIAGVEVVVVFALEISGRYCHAVVVNVGVCRSPWLGESSNDVSVSGEFRIDSQLSMVMVAVLSGRHRGVCVGCAGLGFGIWSSSEQPPSRPPPYTGVDDRDR